MSVALGLGCNEDHSPGGETSWTTPAFDESDATGTTSAAPDEEGEAEAVTGSTGSVDTTGPIDPMDAADTTLDGTTGAGETGDDEPPPPPPPPSEADTCEPCGEETPCKSGMECMYWTDYPEVTFCAPTCETDADCDPGFNMFCVEGVCAPFFQYSCEGDDVVQSDGCGNRLDSSTCAYMCEAGGCTEPEPDESCHGSAKSCYAYIGKATCESQDGCYYSGLYPNGDCGGVATSCSYMDDEYECESQDGCSWY